MNDVTGINKVCVIYGVCDVCTCKWFQFGWCSLLFPFCCCLKTMSPYEVVCMCVCVFLGNLGQSAGDSFLFAGCIRRGGEESYVSGHSTFAAKAEVDATQMFLSNQFQREPHGLPAISAQVL